MYNMEDLFNECKSLGNEATTLVDHLSSFMASIVQNDMVITDAELGEWFKKVKSQIGNVPEPLREKYKDLALRIVHFIQVRMANGFTPEQPSETQSDSEQITSFTGKYRFLSNFWPVKITYEGLEYPSVENAYQASKTLDLEARKSFTTCSSGEAKKMGKTLQIRPDWDKVKVSIMKELIGLKFLNGEMSRMLMDTGSVELIEGNNWGDVFWGVCKGKGKNWLGRLLMEERESSIPF
jgi:ribA/ribD-fused uncharacterized protein